VDVAAGGLAGRAGQGMLWRERDSKFKARSPEGRKHQFREWEDGALTQGGKAAGEGRRDQPQNTRNTRKTESFCVSPQSEERPPGSRITRD
jgi:hypothetical protein